MAARQKGNKFERVVAKTLGAWAGMELMRTPQSGGMSRSFPGDIMPKDRGIRFKILVECKHQECWNADMLFNWPSCVVYAWWQQALAAAAQTTLTPMLIIKRNRHQSLVAIHVCYLPDIRVANTMLLNMHDAPIAVMPLASFLDRYKYDDIRC